MILAGTGHRPDKLGGYGAESRDRLVALAHAAIRKYNPARVITGMALGWDMALAHAAYSLDVPYTAAIPFEGQESRWPPLSQQNWRFYVENADSVIHVSDPGYAAWKMQRRNEWMVDNATHVLALWNGTPGGTANCVAYAHKVGRPVINIWPSWERHSGLVATPHGPVAMK